MRLEKRPLDSDWCLVGVLNWGGVLEGQLGGVLLGFEVV